MRRMFAEVLHCLILDWSIPFSVLEETSGTRKARRLRAEAGCLCLVEAGRAGKISTKIFECIFDGTRISCFWVGLVWPRSLWPRINWISTGNWAKMGEGEKNVSVLSAGK